MIFFLKVVINVTDILAKDRKTLSKNCYSYSVFGTASFQISALKLAVFN